MRSSKGTAAVVGFGVLNTSARLVEWLPVISAAGRLTTATLGVFEFEGSGLFTATSPSPPPGANPLALQNGVAVVRDRKSTRLNSSHQIISYAVFCLKKKKNIT